MTITLDGTLGITTPSETNTGTLSVTGVTTLTGGLNAALPVLSGGTGVTTKTGTGAVVLGTAPTITGATITVASTAAPAFSAQSSSISSFTLNTFTKIPLQTENFDTNGNFDNVTNYRFTPTVAGYYQFNGYIQFSSVNTSLQLVFYKNGVAGYPAQFTSASGNWICNLIQMNGTTDYIELYGLTGSTQNCFGALSGFLARSA